jgi:hypothetical protein
MRRFVEEADRGQWTRGAWNDVPRYIRSAHRGYSDPKDRNWKGFRVARTLVVR